LKRGLFFSFADRIIIFQGKGVDGKQKYYELCFNGCREKEKKRKKGIICFSIVKRKKIGSIEI